MANHDLPWRYDDQIMIANQLLAAGTAKFRLEDIYSHIGNVCRWAFQDGESPRLTKNWKTPLAKLRLVVLLGIETPGEFWTCRENMTATHRDEYGYWGPTAYYRVADFEKHRATIEDMWGGPVIIDELPGLPGSVRVRPAPTIPPIVPLSHVRPNLVTFGTDIFSGEVYSEKVGNIPHMLVAGTSGFGKSVFLNLLITQLLAADPDQVAKLVLVDLKGGIEFDRYRRKSNRVQVVWEFDDVAKVVENLIELMVSRQREMVANEWRLFPGRRVFFVVDEFAQIQLYPAEGKEGRATHDRLIANLNRLSMLGRAVGIVLIAAIQKATTDVMDSSFRMNLQGQACFRVPNRLMASTMFGGVDELKMDPVTLPRGRFIYYDPTQGTTRYLQAHVAAD